MKTKHILESFFSAIGLLIIGLSIYSWIERKSPYIYTLVNLLTCLVIIELVLLISYYIYKSLVKEEGERRLIVHQLNIMQSSIVDNTTPRTTHNTQV
jgi:hypothetical protein